MGSGYSQEDYDRTALSMYETALQNPCLLPDIGLDDSLLKYSGMASNAVLQTYSNELVNNLPGYIERLGSALAPMTRIPNAVGLGALVISMIIEICMKSGTQTNSDTYDMFRRVFGEEKASAVRDTMSEYLRRHQEFINSEQHLREEIGRLEKQLSNHLTVLRNSLLYDGQMSSRGFKIWVNGASFHVQMLIHEARLHVQCGRCTSNYVNRIKATIRLYLQDLDHLLDKYKTYKTHIRIDTWILCHMVCGPTECHLQSDECLIVYKGSGSYPCQPYKMTEPLTNHVFSDYGPIGAMKSHFSDLGNNLNFLINQHHSFTLPSVNYRSVN